MKHGVVILVTLLMSVVHCAAQTEDTPRNADGTKIYSDSALYQGTQLKLDLGTFALEAALSKGKTWSVETAVSVRLKNRFYPTAEIGYVRGYGAYNNATTTGDGGFLKVGMDLNGLRKNITGPSAFLVGVRVCTALQGYRVTNMSLADSYWQEAAPISLTNRFRADAWGEVVAGCNVQIWGGLMMGWNVRFKFLFTSNNHNTGPLPYYIPGYGYRGGTNWGINYYIGYKF